MSRLKADVMDDTCNECLDDCILVVPGQVVHQLPVTSGFVDDPDLVRRVLDAVHLRTFLPRQEAERDPGHVQPIALTYIVHEGRMLMLSCGGDDPSYRLYGKYALWVGGHIEKEDADSENGAIAECLRRELHEELELPEAALSTPELVGLVLDDASQRTRMHLGLVHRAQLIDPAIARALRRPEGTDDDAPCGPALVPIDVLLAELEEFERLEAWSQAIVRQCVRQLCGYDRGQGWPGRLTDLDQRRLP